MLVEPSACWSMLSVSLSLSLSVSESLTAPKGRRKELRVLRTKRLRKSSCLQAHTRDGGAHGVKILWLCCAFCV